MSVIIVIAASQHPCVCFGREESGKSSNVMLAENVIISNKALKK